MNIEEKWKSYRESVLSPKASNAQLIETKRGFYAGVSATINLIVIAAQKDEEAVGQTVEAIKDKCLNFTLSREQITGEYKE